MTAAILSAESDLAAFGFGLLAGGVSALLLASNRLLLRNGRVIKDGPRRPRGYPGAVLGRESARQWKRLIVLGLVLCALGTTVLLLT